MECKAKSCSHRLATVTYPEFESQLRQMAMSQGMVVVNLSVCTSVLVEW